MSNCLECEGSLTESDTEGLCRGCRSMIPARCPRCDHALTEPEDGMYCAPCQDILHLVPDTLADRTHVRLYPTMTWYGDFDHKETDW